MPANAIDAVTHADPYPYYDELLGRGLWWDDSLAMWVAARADDVRAVLGHPAARVRPPGVPVPPALAGGAAGDVFGRLVRMHDHDERAVVKDGIAAALGELDDERVAAAVRASALDVARVDDRRGSFVDRWVTDVPLGAVADLIGIDRVELSVAAEAGRALAACFGPVPPSDAVARAERAVEVLSGLASRAATTRFGLAAALRQALPESRSAEALSNTIGLLFQTADATAGLCANTLARLACTQTTPRDRLASVVAEVAVNDPAVHNTRRWIAEPADLDGVCIGAGEAVLVVLAAANRDQAAGEPLSFGAGTHRCPAADLAPKLAALTVGALLEEWPGVLGEVRPTGYRPLPNARIPTFA